MTRVHCDLQPELGRLLQFISEVAIAIRMNSAYHSASRHNPDTPVDVMWLADALHNFDQLGTAILKCDVAAIVAACDGHIAIYERYKADASGHNSKATFKRWASYVSLDDGIELFRSIKNKVQEGRS